MSTWVNASYAPVGRKKTPAAQVLVHNRGRLKYDARSNLKLFRWLRRLPSLHR